MDGRNRPERRLPPSPCALAREPSPENKETAHNSPHLLPQLLFPARSQSFPLAASPSPSFPVGRRVRGELLALLGPAGLFLGGWGGRRRGAPQGNRGEGARPRRTRWPEPSPAGAERRKPSGRRAQPGRAPEPPPPRAARGPPLLLLSCASACSLSETAEHCLRFPTFGF